VGNTAAARRFVSERFALRALVEDVVGCGVDVPESRFSGTESAPTLAPVLPSSIETLPAHIEGPANAFRRRHRLHEPFALYGGRIDPGKGCEELLEYFQAFLAEGGDATLLLMGVKLMPLPDDPHVRFAGTLPDEERLYALEAATVVVVPSPHESLSLLALEAFAVGTPVLANARSEVLVDHCRRSNAGLFYEDRWEFIEALKLLMRDGALRTAMGIHGRAYVNRNYRWDIILSKYERMMTRLRMPQRDPRDSRGSVPAGGGRPERGDRPDRNERSERSDRPDRNERNDRNDRRHAGKGDGRQGGGRPNRPGRPGDRRQRPR
jgi:glycosyltransferase involved in cell wall biosynthesis